MINIGATALRSALSGPSSRPCVRELHNRDGPIIPAAALRYAEYRHLIGVDHEHHTSRVVVTRWSLEPASASPQDTRPVRFATCRSNRRVWRHYVSRREWLAKSAESESASSKSRERRQGRAGVWGQVSIHAAMFRLEGYPWLMGNQVHPASRGRRHGCFVQSRGPV